MKKVIVIIGASSGIGEATLIKLLKLNYIVYNLSKSAILGYDRNIYLDVSKNDMIEPAIEEVLKLEGRIDCLIYSAGYSMASTIEDVEENDYRYLFEVILFGYIKILKTIIPQFKKQKYGKVIYLNSLASTIAIPFDPYYTAAKSATKSFNESVNMELNRWGIYISNLLFSGVKTNFTYKRNVYDIIDINYNNAVNELAKIEQTGHDRFVIAKKIIKILEKEKPSMNYIVGPKDKLIYNLNKIIPDKLSYKIIKYKFKQIKLSVLLSFICLCL